MAVDLQQRSTCKPLAFPQVLGDDVQAQDREATGPGNEAINNHGMLQHHTKYLWPTTKYVQKWRLQRLAKAGQETFIKRLLVPELWTVPDSRYASTIASSQLAKWSIVKTKRIVGWEAPAAKVGCGLDCKTRPRVNSWFVVVECWLGYLESSEV